MNPEDLLKNFGNALKDEVIATDVDLKVFLNNSIKFRNEDEKNLINENSTSVRKIGNVTDKTEVEKSYFLREKFIYKKVKKIEIII